MIILLILITSSHDNVWISLGENCCWSLLGLKGLKWYLWYNCTILLYLCLSFSHGTIERKSCYVTLPWWQNFLNDNKPKTSLIKWICIVSNFIDLVQFDLIFPMLAKFSGVESERTVYKFRKTKRKSLWCVHLLHKAGAWNIRKFHATVMQRWLKNVQKRMMNVMQLLFC